MFTLLTADNYTAIENRANAKKVVKFVARMTVAI